MKRLFFAFMTAALLLSSCGSVPITGRKQLNLVSDEEVLSSSLSQYNSYMQGAKKSGNTTQSAMVTRVGKKLAAATEDYLKANGLADEVKNYSWEFNLVQDNQLNAFCMPGGKIVVYEGLMKIISSDDELAVVLGHEVAHAVAKHSNERMSQQMLTQYGSQVLTGVLSNKSAAVKNIASSVYGIGAQYGMTLPFSRKHESEADYMGLILMTIAGYNPDVAVGFWQKMSAGGQSSVPEFMSTHPSDQTRINDIQKNLPDIKKKYGRTTTTTTTTKKVTAKATTKTTTVKK